MQNWFEQGGEAYARFRPEYPAELAQYLASIAPSTALAVDVGCGNGQLTRLLASHFDQVWGIDPSADQIAQAAQHPRIQYCCAAAEQLPVAAHSAHLITAAQAAHWFDLPRFYAQVRHIGVAQGVVALISYGVLQLGAQGKQEEELGRRFSHFYEEEIGPYWPAQRKLVDSGYADLPFPFEELPCPALEIRTMWTLPQLLGYIGTWSAVHQAHQASREDILQRFANDLAYLWAEPEHCRQVRWPIHMRLGKITT